MLKILMQIRNEKHTEMLTNVGFAHYSYQIYAKTRHGTTLELHQSEKNVELPAINLASDA